MVVNLCMCALQAQCVHVARVGVLVLQTLMLQELSTNYANLHLNCAIPYMVPVYYSTSKKGYDESKTMYTVCMVPF